ncbi:hypothetical protein [uncultured Maricaulis sp.]|uniref:hypothetical protein n=1 Tax=uncultured Maricaulis sp. TaxID=174710 RepID=UPI0030D88B0E|tara:strand:- start:189501 stop:190106 length:606 start_codon:yes stop_codon:yes gene_type:complete
MTLSRLLKWTIIALGVPLGLFSLFCIWAFIWFPFIGLGAGVGVENRLQFYLLRRDLIERPPELEFLADSAEPSVEHRLDPDLYDVICFIGIDGSVDSALRDLKRNFPDRTDQWLSLSPVGARYNWDESPRLDWNAIILLGPDHSDAFYYRGIDELLVPRALSWGRACYRVEEVVFRSVPDQEFWIDYMGPLATHWVVNRPD